MVNSTQRVVQGIQDKLSAGSLKDGSKLPSERKLAAEFGASRVSIQSAIRELEKMGLVVRRANHRPIVQSPKPSAGPSRSRVADQIAIWILPDLQDLGGMMILQGIRAMFGKVGYRLLIACPPSSDRDVIEKAEVEFLRDLAGNQDVAGAIVWDTGNLGCVAAYHDLIAAKKPLVFIDREPPFDVNADVVACNNRGAARKAVQHLLDLGHRRISMVVASERASSVRDRIEGYRLALEQAEISLGKSAVVEIRENGTDPVEDAQRLLIETLQGPDAPTALFAVNDRIALHLCEAAENLKIGVPDQVSILGFDWLLRGTPSSKKITTVSQPFDEIGRAAAQRLLEQIDSRASEIPREILLSAPLVIGESTGAPSTLAQFACKDILGGNHEKAQSFHSH